MKGMKTQSRTSERRAMLAELKAIDRTASLMQKGVNPRLLFASLFAAMAGLASYAGMLGLEYLDVVEWRAARLAALGLGVIAGLIAVAYYRFSKKPKSLYRDLLQKLEAYVPFESDSYVTLLGFVRMNRYNLHKVRAWVAWEKVYVEQYVIHEGPFPDLNPFNTKPDI